MRLESLHRVSLAAVAFSLSVACGGSSSTVTGYNIVLPPGTTLSVNSGDTVILSIAAVHSDGTLSMLDPSATVTWSNVTTVSAVPATQTGGSPADPIPAFGEGVTAIFVANPARTDRSNDLGNALFFIDPGTAAAPSLTVTATIAGVTPAGTATATFNVGPLLVGNATNGATLFGANGANCAYCHGATGAGSPPNQDGTYTYNGGMTYTYPALGLNAAAGNVASDPEWNQALLAMAIRTDMDNGGIELRAPMPDFFSEKVASTGAILTTQEVADIYAFLQTQTQ